MTLHVADADGVRTLTLNRAERLNALTPSLVDKLLTALSDAATDPAVRCVVLTGAGRGFCAGYDLTGDDEEPGSVRDPASWRPDEVAAHMLRDSQIPVLLHRMEKPTVASIRGPVAGSGMVLAAACDLRIASETARFKLAFASAGRCGDPGGSYLLTHLVGPARARELFLLDDKIEAAQALSIGLVNRVVPDDALERETMAMATRLANGPTGAYAAIKRNLNAAETGSLEETIAIEAPANAQASLSHDGKEAAAAFVEKRAPRFRGY